MNSRHDIPTLNQSPTPPVNALPFDIFDAIITLCVEEEGDERAIPLSHVCQYWKSCILQMPFLWNCLEFSGKTPKWDMLETKLNRSGRAPLDIYVEEEVFTKSAMPHLRRIMQMIAPHIERWRTLRMTDVPHKIRRVLLDQLRGREAPRLERLEVVQGNSFEKGPRMRIKSTSKHWDPRKIFEASPNLKHLEWSSPHTDHHLLPSFRNLITVSFGSESLDMRVKEVYQLVFRILTASPALEEIRIRYHPEWSAWEAPEEDWESSSDFRVTHKSLKHLYLRTMARLRTTILRSINFPNLQSLGESDVSPFYSDTRVYVTYCETLSKSQATSNLRAIELTGSLDSKASVYEGFQPHMPYLKPAMASLQNLVRLAFMIVDFGAEGKWLPDFGIMCPRLESLALNYCRGFKAGTIRGYAETRAKREDMQDLTELTIKLYSGQYMSAEDAAWFSRFSG